MDFSELMNQVIGRAIDLLIDSQLIIELKSVVQISSNYEARLLTDMKFAGIKPAC